MTNPALGAEDPTLFDQLAEQTDNGPESGVPDPPQNPEWRPDDSPPSTE